MVDAVGGVQLSNADGEEVQGGEVLKEKLVGLYFSGQWCIWCRRFTPTLKEFYEELGNDEFELIFVSADKSEKAFTKYYKEMGDWLCVPYGSYDIDTLYKKYHIHSMPTLIILRPDGEVITRNAVAHVKRRKPQETLEMWKSGVIDDTTSRCSIM